METYKNQYLNVSTRVIIVSDIPPDVSTLLTIKGWTELKPPQQQAIEGGLLDSERNFIIISPTSSGKTFTAEMCIYNTLNNGGNAIYLVPTRIIEQEIFNEFSYFEDLGFNVSKTGISRAWEDAQILITTFENFFINILTNPLRLDRYSIVIFDEFHILYDRQRGFNLEKSLILTKRKLKRIICLSATFEDKEEISDWLDAKLIVIPERYRGTPLIEEAFIRKDRKNQEIYDFLATSPNQPFLIFCNTKPYTMARARAFSEYLSTNYPDILPTSSEYNQETIREELIECIGDDDHDLTENELLLISCLSNGVAFHNALLNQKVSGYITHLFEEGRINWIFCTTTLAYGFNSPTKSVLIWDSTWYDTYERKSNPIPVYAYIQMIGRAGRPQYSSIESPNAYAYILANSQPQALKFEREYFKRKLSPVHSHLAHDDYAKKAILQLIYAHEDSGQSIVDFFNESFNAYQARKNPLDTYNPTKVISTYVKDLIERGFIDDMGVYKLTNLGKITVIAVSYKNYTQELITFQQLYDYVQTNGLIFNFETLLFICRILEKRITKVKFKRKAFDVEFISRYGLDLAESLDVCAYIIWEGWLKNRNLNDIESSYGVVVDNLKYIAESIHDGMELMEQMYQLKGNTTPDDFKAALIRMKYGVLQSEVSIVLERGYGKKMAKDLHLAAKSIIDTARTVRNKELGPIGDDLIDFYKRLYVELGRTEFTQRLISFTSMFKERRANKFCDFIELKLRANGN